MHSQLITDLKSYFVNVAFLCCVALWETVNTRLMTRTLLMPAEPRKSVLASIHDLITQETKSIGNQITIGLHDAAQKGLTSVIEKIFDRTMDLNIDMRVSRKQATL